MIKKLKYEDYDDFHKNQIAKREQEELEKALAESKKLALAQTEAETGFYSIFGNVKALNKIKNEPSTSDQAHNHMDSDAREEEDLKRALAESLKDLPGPSSVIQPWEIPPEIPPRVEPEVVQGNQPKVELEIPVIEIKDEGPKCYSIFGPSRTKPKSTAVKGKSIRGSKTRGTKRGRGKLNSRGRGQTTLKRSRLDDAESERKAKLKVCSNLEIQNII